MLRWLFMIILITLVVWQLHRLGYIDDFGGSAKKIESAADSLISVTTGYAKSFADWWGFVSVEDVRKKQKAANRRKNSYFQYLDDNGVVNITNVEDAVPADKSGSTKRIRFRPQERIPADDKDTLSRVRQAAQAAERMRQQAYKSNIENKRRRQAQINRARRNSNAGGYFQPESKSKSRCKKRKSHLRKKKEWRRPASRPYRWEELTNDK